MTGLANLADKVYALEKRFNALVPIANWAAGPWTPVTPSGGWVNAGAGFPQLAALHLLRSDGVPVAVWLLGKIVNGTWANATVVATVGPGFQPITEQPLNCACAGASFTGGACLLTVATNGQIQLWSVNAGGSAIYVNNIYSLVR